MSRTIQPLGNHVLIRPVKMPETSSGGILLPEQSRDRTNEGTILAVGPGKLDALGRMVGPGVTVGDTVMYTWLHGRDVKLNGELLKLLDADEILGVLNDNGTMSGQ